MAHTFQERLAVGVEHERRTAAELRRRGWAVSAHGQGGWAEPVRLALRGTQSAIRWTPDLIAAQGATVALVDGKAATSPHTGRHTVARDAVRAHRQLAAVCDVPIYYVFSDLGVMTPEEVAATCGQHVAIGPRGPYYFVQAGLAHPFDEVFGVAEDPFPAWARELRVA